MQQQQYERFAAGPSFNPVATPDIASGMEREGKYLLRDQQTAQRQIQANNKMLMLDEKYKAEGLQSLAKFSQTIASQLVENQKEENKKQEMQGLQDAYVNGVPPEVQAAFDEQLRQLNESGAATERGLNDAVEGNAVSWALARELSDMSPHMRVGYAQGILRQLGQAYPQQLQTELLDALAEDPTMSVEEKNQRLQDYRYNWMQTTGLTDFNPALLNSTLFPKMQEAEARIINQWRASAEKNQREKLGEDANMLMQQPVSQANWETSSELYRAAGYTRAQARQVALSNIDNLSDLDDWGGLVSFDGKTPLAEKFEKDFDKRRVDILNAEIAKNNYDDNSQKVAARNYAQQFIDAWDSGEPIREADVEKIKRLSRLNYGGFYDPRLDAYDTINVDDFQRAA